MATTSVFCAWPNGLKLHLDSTITVDDSGPQISDAGMGDSNSRKIAFPIQVVTLAQGGNQVSAIGEPANRSGGKAGGQSERMCLSGVDLTEVEAGFVGEG